MPTLGEFIAHGKKYGFSKRQIVVSGPRGDAKIVYLWRNPERFAPLPDTRESDRLERDTVMSLCRRLSIPLEDFGLEE